MRSISEFNDYLLIINLKFFNNFSHKAFLFGNHK